MSWFKNTLINYLGLDALNEVTMYVNNVLNGTAQYNSYSDDHLKLKAIFSNPALMKVISLQCDLFSIGKIYVYKDGKAIDNDPFLEMIKKPNPFQKQSQFLWDVMFWNMVGNTYNYCDSKIVSNDNKLYILENNKIEFPTEMQTWKDKIVLSKASVKTIEDFKVNYKYSDGSTTLLPWKNIIHMPDLTNGTGDWFRGASRIDSLYKVISNSEAALDATNINIRFSGKVMVSGKHDPEKDLSGTPMSDVEKNDIESKANSKKQVYAVKSMVDVKRFVENIGALKLEEAYLHAYYVIGNMYGIPKDVLEAFNSGTYENQEKARGAMVSYCLQPKGNLFFEGHSDFFGYNEQGKTIVIDWEHLPFMQVFAKERAEKDKIKSETLLNLMKAGVNQTEINEMLDLKLTELNYETANRISQSQTGQRQGENNTNT